MGLCIRAPEVSFYNRSYNQSLRTIQCMSTRWRFAFCSIEVARLPRREIRIFF